MLKLFNFHSSDQKNRLFQAKLSVLTKYFGEKKTVSGFPRKIDWAIETRATQTKSPFGD